MKKFLFTGLLSFITSLSAQTVIDLGYSRYFGFSANPILAQIIPFNGMSRQVTTASLVFRSYNFNDNGIRAAYGLGLGSENDFDNMYLSIDSDRRRQLHGKWIYFHGFGGSLKIVSNNFDRTTTVPVKEEYSLGLGWHWGVEYAFNNVFSLSTEANFKFGVALNNGGGGFLKIDPPVNIIAHFNLNN